MAVDWRSWKIRRLSWISKDILRNEERELYGMAREYSTGNQVMPTHWRQVKIIRLIVRNHHNSDIWVSRISERFTASKFWHYKSMKCYGFVKENCRDKSQRLFDNIQAKCQLFPFYFAFFVDTTDTSIAATLIDVSKQLSLLNGAGQFSKSHFLVLMTRWRVGTTRAVDLSMYHNRLMLLKRDFNLPSSQGSWWLHRVGLVFSRGLVQKSFQMLKMVPDCRNWNSLQGYRFKSVGCNFTSTIHCYF